MPSITASSDRIKTGNTKCGWHSCAPATACVSLTMAMSVMGSNKNSFCQAWLEMTPHIPHLPTLPSLKALTQSLDTQVQEKRCAYVFFFFPAQCVIWHLLAIMFTFNCISVYVGFYSSTTCIFTADRHEMQTPFFSFLLCWMNSIQYKGLGAWTS